MKKISSLIFIIAVFSASLCHITALCQDRVRIDIDGSRTQGSIDPMIYGQLFEHIYFSANNGVWQEMIYERSFEKEHFPGIPPRDGYFDGWAADDRDVLHSPTRYEQPIRLTEVEGNDYDIEMDVKWRAYRLAGRMWSGGLMDIRVELGQDGSGEPYFLRLHDPSLEGRRFEVSQTQAMIDANNADRARRAAQKQMTGPYFALSMKGEHEVTFPGGGKRKVTTLDPLCATEATKGELSDGTKWHHLRISRSGKTLSVHWDGKRVLRYTDLEKTSSAKIVLWENYTEALFRDIKVLSKGKTLFEGLPEDVKTPAVAPQWESFGRGTFEMVKGDAVNMDYSQKITSGDGLTGVCQGPNNIVPGEQYMGSIYAKGSGNLIVGFLHDGRWIERQDLGPVGADWQKFSFTLDCGQYSGEASIAFGTDSGGAILIDQATMSTRTGLSLGGFRPDILQTVKDLHPTCLRWPGGGYVAQYNWKWGIGPQEQRVRWPHWMWMDYDQNCFGTDEFIRFCREIDSEPVIVVRVGFDRPEEEHAQILQDALDWVAYCNEPATGKWGSVRARNGHPEPYNVKYWEIDNEMWEMGLEKYEACVREFSTAMREVDPTIKIIACGGFRGGEDEGFIKRSGNYFDFLSLHHYEGAGGYATGPERLRKQYRDYAKTIAEGPNPNIKLFISEWNLSSIDWRTGLFAGGFLNVCETEPVVAMGAAALFIRRTDAPDWNNAFINFDYRDVFVAPNYQVTKLWYDHFSPYRLSFTGDTGPLSISATLASNGGSYIVKVVNPSDKSCSLEIGGNLSTIASGKYEYYAPGDLMVQNSMENKDAVSLRKTGIEVSTYGASLTVPALSAGVVVLERD